MARNELGTEYGESPALPTGNGGGSVEMISPSDYRVYSVPSGQSEAYKKAGYVTTDPNINREEIKGQFQGMTGLGHSFLISTIGGIPFAKSLIAATSTTEEAQSWRESFDAAHREHPVADFIGHTAGLVGGTAAAVSGVGAVAGAVGLGGAAAVGGAEAAGLGAEGIGLGADGLGGVMGASEAATGAGAAAEPGLMSLAAPTIRGAAIKGAVTNTALGHIARIDDSALAHAADPLGKEKIQWGLNEDDLIDAAFGAAIPGVLGGMGKTLGYIGKKLGSGGMDLMVKATTNASKMDEVARQGRMGDVRAKIEEVLKAGRKNPADYVKSRVKIAGSDMEDLKAAVGYAELSQADTDAIKGQMRRVLGKNNRLYRRIAEHLEKETWSVDEMQKLNKKIYKEIEFGEPTLRSANDAKYLKASELVKRGMSRVFQLHDPSADGAMAQKWATALKEESDWLLTKAVVKRGNGPKGMVDFVNDMSSGAATGFLGGALFGAFGGPMNAAANSAAYKAVTSLNTYHYGRAAQMLGKAFEGVDERLTSAVEAGLYGAPTLVAQMGRNAMKKDEYHHTVAKLSAIKNNPSQAFENIHTTLQERGYPEHMIDDAALAQHTQTQFLASKIPARMTAPDTVSRGHGDPVQQRRLMGQVRTMKDPTYGILYPTKTNMEVLQQFYPNVLFNAQQAVLSQLQRNPNIPSASKLWASRITGRPMNNLSSPSFSSMLQQARQAKTEAEAAQQKGAPGGGSQRTQSGSNEGTRMDQLQGGGE